MKKPKTFKIILGISSLLLFLSSIPITLHPVKQRQEIIKEVIASQNGSFNGVVTDIDGIHRWTTGESCENFKGNLTISSSHGDLFWQSDEYGGHFDIMKVPEGEVTVTLNPPLDCDLGCGTWRLVQPNPWQVIETGTGCSVTFNFPGGNWTRTIDFSLTTHTRPRPNGEKILFYSYRDGDWEIYMMNPDGNDIVQLTFNETADKEAAFSPDGTKIVFSRKKPDGEWYLWIMNSDGSNQRKLHNANFSEYQTASFSPDGTKIVYEKWWRELYIINADGTNNHLLIKKDFAAYPHWANDNKIYFSGTHRKIIDIYRINPDGSQLEKVADTTNEDINLKVCGDHVFFSSSNGESQIYRVNKNGSNLIQLTNVSAKNWAGGCSLDNQKIVFTSNREGNFEIYTMDINGKNVTRLTNHPAQDRLGDWGFIPILTPTPKSTATPTPKPTAIPTPKPGDITGDGKVNEADYAVLMANFGKTGNQSQGDLTGDGKINEADYAVLMANFGK